jgi:hypothetical protein
MKLSGLVSISLRNGAVAGVLAFVLLTVLYYLGRHPLLISPFLDFRIMIFGVFIFFSLKEFRDYHQGGILYFWQGMIGALVVVITANAISTVGMQIFGWINKDFVTAYIIQMTDYLKGFPESEIKRIGKDIYDRNLGLLPATNVTDLTITFFAKGILIGLFVSIIVSIILRKQPKN